MKIGKIFSIDIDVIQRLQNKDVNMSQLVNSFLKSYLDMPDSKVRESKKELMEAEAKLVEVRNKLLSIKVDEDMKEAKEAKCIRINL